MSSHLAFAASPRLDTLAISQPESGHMLGCAPNKLCVEIASSPASCKRQACSKDEGGGSNWVLRLSGDKLDPAQTSYRLTGMLPRNEEPQFELWPMLIYFEGGILAGVETSVQAMYSGGGGSAITLHLIAFLPGQPPFEVLDVPEKASVMIRACFSERDEKKRAGACHDEYIFDATIAPAGTSDGMPVLRYRSKATSFPGHVSRSKDSLAGRPLRKRDIVTVIDSKCSYQRWYRFDPKARSYIPDVPPPDCSDYTEP